MMQLKNMIVDTSTAANELLRNWDYDQNTLRFWRASTNFVYLFMSGGETYFLRFVNGEDNSIEQISAEMDFLKYLGRNNYPCACPVMSKNGRYIETVCIGSNLYYGEVFPKVPGEMLDMEEMSLKQYEGWGESLARLHSLSSKYVPQVYRRDSWEDKLNYIRGILIDFPEEKGAMEELDRVYRWLGSLPVSSDNYGLIHYDFETDNVFLDGNTNKYSVIDFDDSMYHWFVMDIVCVLGDIDEMDKEKAKLYKSTFLKGYTSIRKIDDEFIDLMPQFQRFDDLYVFARLLGSMKNSDIPDAPLWMGNIKSKLNRRCRECRERFMNY